jgi:hypothetical protein
MRLQRHESGGPRRTDSASRAFSDCRLSIECDHNRVEKCERSCGIDDGSKITLEVLQLTGDGARIGRGDEKVDGDVLVVDLPGLAQRVAFLIDARLASMPVT